jgi:hypothetical protein
MRKSMDAEKEQPKLLHERVKNHLGGSSWTCHTAKALGTHIIPSIYVFDDRSFYVNFFDPSRPYQTSLGYGKQLLSKVPAPHVCPATSFIKCSNGFG